MVLAFISVVLVWLQLQALWFAPQSNSNNTSRDVLDTTAPDRVTSGETEMPATSTIGPHVALPDEGLSVADVPLTTEQRRVIEKLGFNIDTMVLNEAVVDCARQTLGETRYQAVLAGDVPNVLETARLIPCLRY